MPWLGRLLRTRRAGEGALVWHDPGLQAPESIVLRSPAFADGAPMPDETAMRPVGANVSPELAWTGVPGTARELVLIVEDADVPFARPIVHAVARLSPALSGVSAGDLTMGGPHGDARAAFGRRGYNGPRPIPGHGAHHYVFQLFALDRSVPGDDTLRPATVVQAMRGHVMARGRLTGTFER